MKKKKERTSRKVSPSPCSQVDLKSLIHEHSLFFDKLVQLIPARFYLPADDKEKPWFQGLSKVAKESAKKETRENKKKARRARLDPEKSNTTTLDILKQSLEASNEKPEEDGSSSENEAEIVQIRPSVPPIREDDRSVTYEELRQRLHRKIEELRANRHAPGGTGTDDISNRAKKREIQQGNRERYEEESASSHKKKRKSKEGGGKDTDDVLVPVNNDDKTEKDVEEATQGLAFTHVKIGDDDGRARKKAKKLSKLQLLEQAKKLQEDKKDPEKGEVVAKKHSWQAATSRAAGIKVHDDPKLVNKSIKKEKKKHMKNVEKWKDRVQSTEKLRAEKQQTRSKNISDRIQQKKMRKIAKREKKLMRPGFEGRKDGYINDKDKSSS